MLKIQGKHRHKTNASADTALAPSAAAEVTHVAQPFLWLALAVPMAALLFCGSKEPWAMGGLALLVGLCLLLATPRFRVTPAIKVPIAAAIVLCLSAFLPAAWFPLPEWRAALQEDFGIVMPGTRSPQPWISLESLLWLCVACAWLIFCLARGFTSRERRAVIQVLTVFIALLAITAIALRYWKVEVPFFWRAIWNTGYFGPFPNRNNFSGLLAVGALLAFAAGYDAIRRKKRSWIIFAAAMVPIFSGVLLNTSRLGIVALFGGLAAWFFTATFHKRSAKRVAISTAILMAVAAVFLLFGKRILARFFEHEGSLLATLSQEGRWGTFADAVQMMAMSPIFGVGLGNFEPVFAMTRTSVSLYSRALHPESDWLWFGAEAGLPCLVLAVAAFLSMARRFGPWRRTDASGRQDRRLRTAAGVAVVLIAVEALVDTPVHAPGFAMVGALLAGLAMRPSRQAMVRKRSTFLWRRGMGAMCASVGILWLFTAAGIPLIPGNFLVWRLSREATELVNKGDDAGALEKWQQAAKIKPLQWNLYAEQAMLKLRLGRPVSEALDDFARTRRLERQSAILCCLEFDYWMRYHPLSGMPALREAMRRDPSRALEFFAGRLQHMSAHPELREEFGTMAREAPKLHLAYLRWLTGDAFRAELQLLLENQPDLEAYTSHERLQLFQAWLERGDASKLVAMLEQNSAWRADGWSVLATHRAKEGNFQAAYELAMSNLPVPFAAGSRREGKLAELNRVFLYNPTDIARGLDLFEAQKNQGLNDEALATLDQLAALPHAPAKVLYERAVILARKGDYAKAWDAILAYMKRMEAT